jgi:hypothetical protein
MILSLSAISLTRERWFSINSLKNRGDSPKRADSISRVFSPFSDRNPLDLINCNLVAGAVIEFCRARAFMRSHGLRVLQRAAGFKIGGDARGAEGMATDPGARAELGGAALDPCA